MRQEGGRVCVFVGPMLKGSVCAYQRAGWGGMYLLKRHQLFLLCCFPQPHANSVCGVFVCVLGAVIRPCRNIFPKMYLKMMGSQPKRGSSVVFVHRLISDQVVCRVMGLVSCVFWCSLVKLHKFQYISIFAFYFGSLSSHHGWKPLPLNPLAWIPLLKPGVLCTIKCTAHSGLCVYSVWSQCCLPNSTQGAHVFEKDDLATPGLHLTSETSTSPLSIFPHSFSLWSKSFQSGIYSHDCDLHRGRRHRSVTNFKRSVKLLPFHFFFSCNGALLIMHVLFHWVLHSLHNPAYCCQENRLATEIRQCCYQIMDF